MSVNEKRALIDKSSLTLSIRSQCDLIGLNRSNLYYRPVEVSCETLDIMNHIDRVFTKHPFFGSRKIRKDLLKAGYVIGKDRVQSLMRQMGLYTIYPKKKTSKAHPDNKVYPYLLTGMVINKPNQVWSADITYIRLSKGFIYLTAIIDWFSRYCSFLEA